MHNNKLYKAKIMPDILLNDGFRMFSALLRNNIQFLSNNCLGVPLQLHYYPKFSNPFSWSRINVDQYYELIKNFGNIDFNNIEHTKATPTYYPDPTEKYALNIDNCFTAIFPHVYKDTSCIKPKRDSYKIHYCCPEQLIESNYIKRLKRMELTSLNNAVFVLCINKTNPSEEEIKYTEKISQLLKNRNDKAIIISPIFNTKVDGNILYISEFVENLHDLSVSVIDKFKELNFL